MLDLFVYIFLLVVILIVFGSAVYASFRASPWLPVFKRDIERILRLAEIKDNDLVYDLGSGDGRIVTAVANNSQAKVIGYEVSFIPYLWSKLKLFFLGLSKRAEIRYADFLTRDLGQATVIFCFLTPMAMRKLQPKFEKELKEGTRVISYSFHIPYWKEVVEDQPDEYSMPIFKYIVDPDKKFNS